MKKIGNHSEKGQALVLFVVGIAVFIGFVALAIDGGMLLSDRRQAQNAADSAAMAAALARMSNQNWQTAGLNAAAAFDYDNDGVENWVSVHNPPVTGLYATVPNASQYIQVFITSTLKTSFAQLVFSNLTQNSVMAVGRARPSQSIFPGNALHATNPSQCNAVTFSGSGDVDINGGNVFSNSLANGNPTSCHSGIVNGSGGDIDITGGGIVTAGTFRNQSGGEINAEDGIIQGADQQDLPQIPIPSCAGLTNRSYNGGAATLLPGIYNGGIRLNNAGDQITMSPGMYCLGDDFTANGGSVTGTEVFIYQQSGELDLGGNTSIDLTRTSNLVDADGNQWAGMLYYMDPNNTSLVNISGNSGSSYTGTFLAAGLASPSSQPKCSISGTGDNLGLNSQVICNTVEITGDAILLVNFNEEDNYRLPPIIELVE